MEPPQKRAKQLLEVLGNLVDPKPHRSLIEPFKEPCQESLRNLVVAQSSRWITTGREGGNPNPRTGSNPSGKVLGFWTLVFGDYVWGSGF